MAPGSLMLGSPGAELRVRSRPRQRRSVRRVPVRAALLRAPDRRRAASAPPRLPACRAVLARWSPAAVAGLLGSPFVGVGRARRPAGRDGCRRRRPTGRRRPDAAERRRPRHPRGPRDRASSRSGADATPSGRRRGAESVSFPAHVRTGDRRHATPVHPSRAAARRRRAARARGGQCARHRARVRLRGRVELQSGVQGRVRRQPTRVQKRRYWPSPQNGQRSDRAWSGLRQCQQKRGCGASRAFRRRWMSCATPSPTSGSAGSAVADARCAACAARWSIAPPARRRAARRRADTAPRCRAPSPSARCR